MSHGEGHRENDDKSRHTKASYRTWSLASRFPNNTHKDSIFTDPELVQGTGKGKIWGWAAELLAL